MKNLILNPATFILMSVFMLYNCSKNEEPLPSKTSIIKANAYNDGGDGDQWTGDIVVETFYDGTDPEYPALGCAGNPSDCLFTYDVVGKTAQEISNLAIEVEGSNSETINNQSVYNYYEYLSEFIPESVLNNVLDYEYYLELKTDNNKYFFILKESESNEIIRVKPVVINL